MPTTIYPAYKRSEWILAQRPGRSPVDPWKPNGYFLEQERGERSDILSSAVILLTNKECPWRCLMCDLWKHTLDNTVPLGAIPAQIAHALAALDARPAQIKLYNSGSFFDRAAIPPADYRAIAEQVRVANHVVVESHPRLVGVPALKFRDLLSGSLEVAMGLETVHPTVLPRLNKRFTLEEFSRAAAFLRGNKIRVRSFVLVQPPFMVADEAVEWAVKSAQFAFSCGAVVVSLIPTRLGNGAMNKLARAGEFSTPSLITLETAMERCLQLRQGRVFADTWELQQFSSCRTCLAAREARLVRMNLSQRIEPSIQCAACSASLL